MAWVKITEEEAKQHPLYDKFCWVRVLFIPSMVLAVFIFVCVIGTTAYMIDDITPTSFINTIDKFLLVVFGSLFFVVITASIVLAILSYRLTFQNNINKQMLLLSLVFMPALMLPIAFTNPITAVLAGILVLVNLINFTIYKLIAIHNPIYRLQYHHEIKISEQNNTPV